MIRAFLILSLLTSSSLVWSASTPVEGPMDVAPLPDVTQEAAVAPNPGPSAAAEEKKEAPVVKAAEIKKEPQPEPSPAVKSVPAELPKATAPQLEDTENGPFLNPLALPEGNIEYPEADGFEKYQGPIDKPPPFFLPEQRAETAPAPSSPAPSKGGASQNTASLKLPIYDRVNPEWGLQLAYSFRSLDKSRFPTQGHIPMRAVSFQLDYLPLPTHRYGILGLGFALGAYPVNGRKDVFDNLNSSWSVGAQASYQARFFHSQIFVPVGGYRLDHWFYDFKKAGAGSLWLQGPFVGLWLMLNVLDPRSASNFFSERGVSKTYLVSELRFTKGSNDDVTLEGSTYFFGLRFEF